MTSNPPVQIAQSLPLEQLTLSTTTSQVERRRHFDATAIAELAESLKTVGQLAPIIVRQWNSNDANTGQPRFEVVAGERRLMAARVAGLKEVMVSVRDLSDEQVLEVQLVENLQREGLSELAEAEGYEELMKRHLYSVDDLVAKVGKSKAYVYARLKLTALCKEARKAFYEGNLNASTALLVARIPIHDLQRKALKEITEGNWRGPMTYREAANHVQNTYMLRLDHAPFPTSAPELVPDAGPCGSCPKRTGNQKELFGDVKSADVCTDPVCYAAKRDANLARLAAVAEASGRPVLSEAEAKKINPGGHRHATLKGHVRLSDHCYQDSKNRTFAKLVGKDVEVKYLQDKESGELVAIAAEEDVRAAMKKRGVKLASADSGNERFAAEQRARERRRRIETEFRRRVYSEIRAAAPPKASRAELELIAHGYWSRLWSDAGKDVLKLWDEKLEKKKGGYGLDVKGPMERRIPKMTDAELVRFLLDLVFAGELVVHSYSMDKPTLLLDTAKRQKVNVDKIRRLVQTELAPKKKPSGKTNGKKS